MKECISFIEEYTKGLSEEEFLKDEKVQDAVIRRIEIIGEATKNIPMSLKEKNKQVPWFKISEFRNLITHFYYQTSLNRIWKAVKEDIPIIKEGLKNIQLV
ncbi:MAG: DUF86 domain-containing protein [Nanoarchaeota archaeon]|nr:DUF86 domain-containing protein [Nanoarchaeota archaeon]